MIYLLSLAFIAGVLVKLTDFLGDKRNKWAILFGILYGLAIGYLISNAPFSMLFLGALFAQAIAGKIDRFSHVLGFALALLSAFYFGFPIIQLFPVLFFLVFAYLDELKLKGRLKTFSKYRLFLKIGALLFFLFSLDWNYFLGILVFDIGYLIAEYARQRF